MGKTVDGAPRRPKALDAKTTRRRLIAAGVAAPAALMSQSASAQTDGITRPEDAERRAARPMRAVHRFSIGAIRVTAIDDGRFTFPTSMFALGAPDGAAQALLEGYGMPGAHATLPVQVLLIESGGTTALIDAGLGDLSLPGGSEDHGRVVDALAMIGVARQDVDVVILSHGHPDHIGGVRLGDSPAFPNALHYLPAAELEFWTQDPARAPESIRRLVEQCRISLAAVDHRLRNYSDGDEVVPGVAAISAPGHTINHHAFMIHDGGERLLHLMDAAVHYILALERPDWGLGAEFDQDMARETRHRLLARAADERILTAGYHFPFPGVGRIVRMGDGYRFIPTAVA